MIKFGKVSNVSYLSENHMSYNFVLKVLKNPSIVADILA